jgi:hypothetical protein
MGLQNTNIFYNYFIKNNHFHIFFKPLKLYVCWAGFVETLKSYDIMWEWEVMSDNLSFIFNCPVIEMIYRGSNEHVSLSWIFQSTFIPDSVPIGLEDWNVNVYGRRRWIQRDEHTSPLSQVSQSILKQTTTRSIWSV